MVPSSMENEFPYHPPASPPPSLPASPMLEPSAVRVFGIMHLVFGGFGLLFGAWNVLGNKMNSMFLDPKAPGYEAQLRYMEEVRWVSILTGIFMIVLAGLLLVAGIKLVRSRPDGVAWSNRYAWASIATKLVSLVIAVAVLLPAMRRMIGGIMPPTPGMPPGTAEAFSNIMQMAISVGSVAGPLVSCVYPGLALYFLSRPPVKEWAARTR